MNVLHVKQMFYYRRGAISGLDLYVSHDWCVIIQKTHGSCLSKRHFVRTFGHKLQTIRCTLAFYIPNDSSTTGDVIFWLYNCMQALTVEVRLQICIINRFSYVFYMQITNNWVYTSVLHTKQLLYYNRHLWLVSYISKYVLWILSPMKFCAYFRRKFLLCN